MPELACPRSQFSAIPNKLIFAGKITSSLVFKINSHKKEGHDAKNKVRSLFLASFPEDRDIFCPVHHHTLVRKDKFWALKEYLLNEVNASCLPRFLQTSTSLWLRRKCRRFSIDVQTREKAKFNLFVAPIEN